MDHEDGIDNRVNMIDKCLNDPTQFNYFDNISFYRELLLVFWGSQYPKFSEILRCSRMIS